MTYAYECGVEDLTILTRNSIILGSLFAVSEKTLNIGETILIRHFFHDAPLYPIQYHMEMMALKAILHSSTYVIDHVLHKCHDFSHLSVLIDDTAHMYIEEDELLLIKYPLLRKTLFNEDIQPLEALPILSLLTLCEYHQSVTLHGNTSFFVALSILKTAALLTVKNVIYPYIYNVFNPNEEDFRNSNPYYTGDEIEEYDNMTENNLDISNDILIL